MNRHLRVLHLEDDERDAELVQAALEAEGSQVELAASEGRSWNDLPPDEQLIYYARARLNEGGPRQQ